MARIVRANNIDVLVDCVGGAQVPGGFQALLRRQQLHELAQFAAHEAPAALHVLVEAVGLVLRQDTHFTNPRVDAVGQGEVEDAEFTAEMHRRLGTPAGQVLQPRAPTPGQHQGQGIPGEQADISRGIWCVHWRFVDLGCG